MFTGNTRSNQDIIEYLHKVFVVGGAPACVRVRGEDPDCGGCMYTPQTSTQVGCAVGCLLPWQTTEEWDKYGPASIRDIYMVSSSGYYDFFDDNQLDFLSDIQMFHDQEVLGHYERDHRYNKLSVIAKKYNLNLCKEN